MPQDVALIPHILTPDTCRDAMICLDALAEDSYHHLVHPRWGPSARKGEAAYGRDNQEPIPPQLRQVADEIRHYFTQHFPGSALAAPMQTLTVQRYKPGEGLSKHRDGPKAKPFVVGVTLCHDQAYIRKLRFRQVCNPDIKYDLLTPHASVYVFHGDAYNSWTHESVKSKKQKQLVYSLTFRTRTIRTSSYETTSSFSPFL